MGGRNLIGVNSVVNSKITVNQIKRERNKEGDLARQAPLFNSACSRRGRGAAEEGQTPLKGEIKNTTNKKAARAKPKRNMKREGHVPPQRPVKHGRFYSNSDEVRLNASVGLGVA